MELEKRNCWNNVMVSIKWLLFRENTERQVLRTFPPVVAILSSKKTVLLVFVSTKNADSGQSRFCKHAQSPHSSQSSRFGSLLKQKPALRTRVIVLYL